MPMGIIFWMLMVFWAIFGVVGAGAPDGFAYRRHVYGGWGILTFILFFLIGWKLFGFVVQ